MTEQNKDPLPAIEARLAAFAHNQWSGWMKYFFGKCRINEDGTATIPAWAMDRWQRQMNTDYDDLSSDEKASDLEEAGGMIEAADLHALLAEVKRLRLQVAQLAEALEVATGITPSELLETEL